MTLELSELAARAADVIAAVNAGEPVLLTRDGVEVATIRPKPLPKPIRQFGLGVGRGHYYMAPDFNDPLPDEFWQGGGT